MLDLITCIKKQLKKKLNMKFVKQNARPVIWLSHACMVYFSSQRSQQERSIGCLKWGE